MAGGFALLGLILLTVGVLLPETIAALAGLAAVVGGTGTLAGQGRR